MTDFEDITFSRTVSSRRAIKRAQLLIDHYQLHARPWEPTPIDRLLHDFELRFLPLIPTLHGFTLDTGHKIVIGINADLTAAQTQYVAMHEVGHVTLQHPNQVNFCAEHPIYDRAVESEANTFAAMVLLPRAAVFDVGPDCIDLPEVAAFYTVPPALVRIRLALFELFRV